MRIEDFIYEDKKVGLKYFFICDNCNKEFYGTATLGNQSIKKYPTECICHECSGINSIFKECLLKGIEINYGY